MQPPVFEKSGKDGLKFQFFAKTNCKKCYGRGFIGQNITYGEPQPCTCLKAVAIKPGNVPAQPVETKQELVEEALVL
jgi:hypothetical protein